MKSFVASILGCLFLVPSQASAQNVREPEPIRVSLGNVELHLPAPPGAWEAVHKDDWGPVNNFIPNQNRLVSAYAPLDVESAGKESLKGYTALVSVFRQAESLDVSESNFRNLCDSISVGEEERVQRALEDSREQLNRRFGAPEEAAPSIGKVQALGVLYDACGSLCYGMLVPHEEKGETELRVSLNALIRVRSRVIMALISCPFVDESSIATAERLSKSWMDRIYQANRDHNPAWLQQSIDAMFSRDMFEVNTPLDLDQSAQELERCAQGYLWTLGSTLEGLAMLEEAIVAEPRLVLANVQLASFNHLGKGDSNRAKQLLCNAIHHNPQQPEFFFVLGNIMADEGDDLGAIDSFRTACQQGFGGMASALFNLGNAYLGYHNEEHAIHAYRQALQEDPTHGKSWSNLLITLAKLGRNQEASTLASQRESMDLSEQDRTWMRTFRAACPDLRTPEGQRAASDLSFHGSARAGCLARVEELLGAGEPVDGRDPYDWTALHRAAETGRVDVLAVLSEWGADLEAKTVDGATPLHIAAGNGQLAAVRSLLASGAQLDAIDDDGYTPFFMAAIRSRIDVADVLLDAGATLQVVDSSGVSPLHFAAQEGRADTISFMAARGIDPELEHPSGLSPLHFAALRGRTAAVMALLEAGADADSMKRGWTPLLLAASKGVTDVVKTLLAAGADPAIASPDGKSCSTLARESGYEYITLLLERDVEKENNE